jgi:tetratricopeptide (TPR) repeat protein
MEGKLSNGLENNILYALLWAGRFDELRDLASKRPRSSTVDYFFLAAIAAKNGISEAVAQAGKRIPDEKDRTAALLTAGQTLLKLRLYKEAADLIETAAAGGSQAATLRASATAIRKAQRYETYMKTATTPMAALLRFFPVMFLTNVPPETVQSVFVQGSVLSKPDSLKAIRAAMAPFRSQVAKAGVSLEVATDIALGAIQGKVDGDDSGYRIRADIAGPTGAQKMVVFIVLEAGEYRVVCLNAAGPLGALALKNLEAGKPDIARRWLDWAREIEQLKGGEDPLAGAPFPRFWSRGSDAPPETIRYAAASLMANSEDAEQEEKAIPILAEGRAKAASPEDRLKFDLALAAAYSQTHKYELLLPIVRDLLQAHPDSESAFGLVVLALTKLKKSQDAMQVVNERLARNPEDHAALAVQVSIAMRDGDAEKSIELGKKIIAAGSSTPQDWNNMAWSFLMANRVTPEAIEFAQKGVYATQSSAFGVLHTLAALYAETGKTTEAREVILQAMEVAGQEEPEDNSWYVFGRIDEQYGITSDALAAYRRVSKPSTDEGLAGSSWAIAQRRLATLERAQ